MDNQSLEDALKRADALARNGDFTNAISVLKSVLANQPNNVQTLTMLSRVYRANGNVKDAIENLTNIVEQTPDDPWSWYDLGASYESLEDYANAASAYLKAWRLNTKNARFALTAGYALWQDNQKQDALSVWSLGADIDPLVRIAQFREEADVATREKSKLADTELRRHFTQLFETSLEKFQSPERLVSAVWPQTHFGDVVYKVENQKPYMFYAPDLPPEPVFETSALNWAQSLKMATPDVIAELNQYLTRTRDYGRPYLSHVSGGEESWRSLQGSEDWNALHLYKDAKLESCAEFFPKTLAALEDVPLVEMFKTPMEVFFSVLKPGTHIPPHFGLSNSRLTAHLPLIIPKDCQIRVAEHVHRWEEGELFLFDDSFDHEARNDSEDIRIVLIFETWRPDLTKAEIATLQHSMESRTTWLNNCLLYTSPSPRDRQKSRMPSSA